MARGGGPARRPTTRKELLRGALVFAIGSLDAFLHDLVLEIVPRFGPRSEHLTEALRTIAKEDPSLSLRVALAPDGDAKRDEFSAALDRWLSAKSFHGPEAVVRALGYVGCTVAWSDIDTAWGRSAAVDELARFTTMRHDIVHRGRKPNVVRATSGQCVDLVEAIGKTINGAVVALHYR